MQKGYSESRGYNLGIAKELGLEAALAYNQLLFWATRTSKQWFYKSYEEMMDELPLSKYQLRKGYHALENAGYIEMKLKKVDGAPTLHFRISKFLTFQSENFKHSMESKNFKHSINNKEPIKHIQGESASPPPSFSVDETSQDDTPRPTHTYETTSDRPSTNALHYRVIKKYSLPISNHNEIRAKSKRMDEEIEAEAAQDYLQRLLDVDYNSVHGQFKPELNHSRDIYNKRLQITTFLDKNAPRKKTWAPPTEEEWVKQEEARKSIEWGF